MQSRSPVSSRAVAHSGAENPAGLSLVTPAVNPASNPTTNPTSNPAARKPDRRAGRKLTSRFRSGVPLVAEPAPTTLTLEEFEQYVQVWLLDCQSAQHTERTIGWKSETLGRVLWWLRRESKTVVGTAELRGFFAYLSTGHREPLGRWDDPRYNTPPRPSTVKNNFIVVRAFFNWIVRQGILDVSPVAPLTPPVVREDQISPFSADQVLALLDATQHSWHPKRDKAIVYFLLDTGIRASELCALKMRDVDLAQRRIVVLGKGNKYRALTLGQDAYRALWEYLKEQPRKPDTPLFMNDRGIRVGQHLKRAGLLRIIQRLGAHAGLAAVRVSPHTFRHTFAIMFLRNGGNVFALQQILGHTTLTITRRYAALAELDVAQQQRNHSPGDFLRQ